MNFVHVVIVLASGGWIKETITFSLKVDLFESGNMQHSQHVLQLQNTTLIFFYGRQCNSSLVSPE